MSRRHEHEHDHGTAVAPGRPEVAPPPLYSVLLLNDDYTPMEFVVLVLQDVFNKSREDAMRIMLHVHQKGVGECGIGRAKEAAPRVAMA